MTIFVRLIGGLGNQMFQYAVGRALALRRGVDLVLDVSAFGTYRLHAYGLHHLSIKAQVGRSGEESESWARRLVPRFARRVFPSIEPGVYRERSLAFDPEVLSLPDGVCLDGYWQSEHYFKDSEYLIRSELSVRTPASEENLRALEKIRNCEAVSIHVRRGDYVVDPHTNAVHGVCELEYYQKAVSYIANRCQHAPHLFVFSDDPEWIAENFKLPYETTLVRHNGANTGYEDLRLMSACKHHVIANSSFSWWGAWLNPSPTKIVVAPRAWFRSPSLDSSDIVPDGWIKL